MRFITQSTIKINTKLFHWATSSQTYQTAVRGALTVFVSLPQTLFCKFWLKSDTMVSLLRNILIAVMTILTEHNKNQQVRQNGFSKAKCRQKYRNQFLTETCNGVNETREVDNTLSASFTISNWVYCTRCNSTSSNLASSSRYYLIRVIYS